MVVDSSGKFLGGLRQFIHSCRSSDLDDRQLLKTFLERQDEAAFEALVHRHGATVLGVWHVGFSQDSQNILVVRADGWVRIYDLKAKKNLANLPAHPMIAPTGAFVRGSKTVLTLG